jgi:hypothetical protein
VKREFSGSLAPPSHCASPASPLTSGGATPSGDRAHHRFRRAAVSQRWTANLRRLTLPTPDWARAAASAPPTLPAEYLIPPDDVPMWLKAAVFIGGSMVIGAMCAHLSGSCALAEETRRRVPVEAAKSW